MNIAVIGPGAMGLLFAGFLSRKNNVLIVGRNEDNMKLINEFGVKINSGGCGESFFPKATVDTKWLEPFGLVILLTKTGDSEKALSQNTHIINEDTILMTLQNGAGNEGVLKKFTAEKNIIVGNTNQGAGRLTPNEINHTGFGKTFLGALDGDSERFKHIAENFKDCGIDCELSSDIRQIIWNKLMINASSSVLSGILGVRQGYIVENPAAWELEKSLIREICSAASAEGYAFDVEEQTERLKNHLTSAPMGYTSIYNDLKAGRKTEASVITGAVVEAAERLGVEVPVNKTILRLVYAMEGRDENDR